MGKLNKKELDELKGGDVYQQGGQATVGNVSKTNNNTTYFCRCDYRDFSAISNKNSADGCSCNCKA